MSNNALFLKMKDSPFLHFFNRGLNVSLSSDDPMMFHLSEQPLMEEYSVVRQYFSLNMIDLAEIARNSVLQSGFSHEKKVQWLGPKYQQEGIEGNDSHHSNVPDIRVGYRSESVKGERVFLGRT
jgi:AMP deaminase